MKDLMLGLMTMGIVVGCIYVSNDDFDYEQAEAKGYCERVELWNNSNGDVGHPNYKNKKC